MPFRILLDENVASEAEAELEGRGHDAVHVLTADELGTGTSDVDLVAFVNHTDRLLITGDTGFLEPNHRGDATVLFCQDDDLPPELAAEVGEAAESVTREKWGAFDTFDWRLHRKGLRLYADEADRCELREAGSR